MLKIGHRGGKAHVAENTIESFKQAIVLGADGVELDVHICATGEVIVIHDFTVNRTTSGSGMVNELTLSDINNLTIDNKYKVPMLTEVLDALGNKIFINVELKGRGTAKQVATILQDYINNKGFNPANFLVSSFNKDELMDFKNCHTALSIGVLTENSIEEAILWAEELAAQAIHAGFTVLNKKNVEQMQQAGYKVLAWTVNEPEHITQIKAYGVDGIISDYPERL